MDAAKIPASRVATGAPTVRTSGGFRMVWHVGLWVGLAAISAAILLIQQLPTAGRNELLAVAIATTGGIVGLSLLQLGMLRFMVFGRLIDLFAGLAFGSLAVANLAVGVLGQIGFFPLLARETGPQLFLMVQLAASALFLLGLVRGGEEVPVASRTEFGWRALVLMGLLLMAGTAGLLSATSSLPPVVDPQVRLLLDNGVRLNGALPGQAGYVVIVNGLVAMLLLLASLGYMSLWGRQMDPQLGWLGAALTLLFFGQLHALLFPFAAADYISASDFFRLGAYLVLLFSLVTRLTGEISERSTRDERLRLSRELHDGLAQQLSLLNLRLSRAASPERPAAARARDLEAAKRLVELATLEARQAITALRTGTVTWEDFGRTLGTFADEFANNHEVEVRFATEGFLPSVEAELQAEVLRIMHEAMSNAIRHGQADRIEAKLIGRAQRVEVLVTDNGDGFEPAPALASGGVGLRSMSERLERRGGTLFVESAPGQGTTIRALMPVGVQASRSVMA